jgi:hypothetical protein
MKFDLEALKAEFAARGGQVTRVEVGARAIESDRAIYRAMREGGRVAADAVRESRDAEARAEARHGAYHAARADGWSQANALDYAEHAKP